MDRKKEAQRLRLIGKSIIEIAQIVEAAKSSVSLWVRDIPQPEKFTKEYRRKQKLERLEKLKQERVKKKRVRKDKILSGCGYYMITTPKGYKGKVYNERTNLIYEHRYVLEQKIGRLLKENEIAHHLNEIPTDNRPENLKVKTKSKHARDHQLAKGRQVVVLKCPSCRKIFERDKGQIYHLQKKGIFTACSKKCRGKFSTMIQYYGMTSEVKERISENIVKEYRKMHP